METFDFGPETYEQNVKFIGISGLHNNRILTEDYIKDNPEHKIFKNVSVFTETGGMIWNGDIDLDIDAPALKEIAMMIGDNLFILNNEDVIPGKISYDYVMLKSKYIVKNN